MVIKAGQLIQAAKLVGVDLGTLPGVDLSSLSGEAEVGEDILSLVALVWPPAGLIAEALVIALVVAPLLRALNIKPDPNPMVDAQTTETPHTGRNP